MRFERTCLESIGYCLPQEIVTSERLERQLAPLYERLRLPEGRLELMTGIRERRFWRPGALPSDESVNSAEQAIAAAGIDRRHIGALGFVGYLVFGSKMSLLLPMVGLGMAWGSILALPYAILADALPARKMGIYMGIFNFFIVLPQILVGGTMSPILRTLEGSLAPAVGGAPLLAMLFGAASLALAAFAMSFVKTHHAD